MQVLDAGLHQMRDHSVGVAGHVGHFGGNRVPAKSGVQPLRDAQPIVEQLAVHQLGVGGQGQAVPGDDSIGNGLLQQGRVFALFQVELNKEGAHCPDKIPLAVLVDSPGGGNGPGDEGVQIPVQHSGGRVCKADVQVGLVHHDHFFDVVHNSSPEMFLPQSSPESRRRGLWPKSAGA